MTSSRRPAVIRLAMLLLAASGVSPAASSAPLPRLVIAVPAGADAAGIARAALAGGLREVAVSLPPVAWSLDGSADSPGVATWPAAGAGLPAGAQLHRTVVLAVAAFEGEAHRREELLMPGIDRLVAALAGDSPPATGLTVGLSAPIPAPEVTTFVVASLAVRLRAVIPGVQITVALAPGLLDWSDDALGRLIAYSDALAVGRGEAAGTGGVRIARLAAGRPVALSVGVTGASGEAAAEAFLDALGDDSPLAPQTLVVEAASAEQAARLGRTAQFLGRALGGGFEAAPLAGAPVSIAIDGVAVTRGRPGRSSSRPRPTAESRSPATTRLAGGDGRSRATIAAGRRARPTRRSRSSRCAAAGPSSASSTRSMSGAAPS